MININLTPAASDFIKKSLIEINDDQLNLRIAVYPDDNNYNYGIGFDTQKDNDLLVMCDDIGIVLNEGQSELLDEATLDYVKMDDGTLSLIVLNPNDPSFVPPKKSK